MAGGQTALEILGAAEQWTLGEPTIVVLHGDEPFLAGRMLALLRDRLCPDEADREHGQGSDGQGPHKTPPLHGMISARGVAGKTAGDAPGIPRTGIILRVGAGGGQPRGGRTPCADWHRRWLT